jgi:hypothetical protein
MTPRSRFFLLLEIHRACVVGLVMLLAVVEATASDPSYSLAFSTYLGGNRWDHARDVATDSQDNIILVGGTAGSFPATTGAYDTQYNDGVTKGPYAGQHTGCDAFVAKFSPTGTLLWCTYLGGPNYDRAYAVEVDSQDNIVVSGRAGPDFPTTPGAFQESYSGILTGSKAFYGYQNAFVAKVSSDGTQLLWASYVGKGELCRGVDIDEQDDIFVSMASGLNNTRPDPTWFATAFNGAYRSTPIGGPDVGVVKVTGDGSQVLWATWIGGSGDDHSNANIRLDHLGYPYLTMVTESLDVPVTTNAYQATHGGGSTDIYLAKFSKDGTQLLHGTYIGGDGGDVFETHPTAIDREGNVFVTFGTSSSNIQPTPGCINTGRSGTTDAVVAKFSPSFQLQALALIGGNDGESFDGISADARGRIFASGSTQSTNFPVTTNAYQSTHAGDHDALSVVFDNELTRLIYSTYLGGGEYDLIRGSYMDAKGNIYGAGAVVSTNFPTAAAHDSTYGGSNDPRWGNGDAMLVKFVDDNLYIGDADRDLLPDTWENTHFHSLNQDGTDDDDLDGDNNRIEFLQGTDPTDPDSRLKCWMEGSGSRLRFGAASDLVSYEVWWTHDFVLPRAQWNRSGMTLMGPSAAAFFDLPDMNQPPYDLRGMGSVFFRVAATPLF